MTACEQRIQLAEDVRRAAGSLHRLRCDLERFCQLRGIDIKRAPLQNRHGSLVTDSGGHVIVLNSGDGGAKQRFTLAHEIAHFVLGTSSPTPAWRGESDTEPRAVAVERECDALAAEILMPTPNFARLIAGDWPTISGLSTLAADFDVSLESCALRFAELTQAQCQIAKWVPDGSDLRCAWASGPVSVLARGERVCLGDEKFRVHQVYHGEITITDAQTLCQPDHERAWEIESRGFGRPSRRYVLSIVRPEEPRNSGELRDREVQWRQRA